MRSGLNALGSMNLLKRAMSEISGTIRAHFTNEDRQYLSVLAVFRVVMGFSGSGGRDSNPRQPAWEAGRAHDAECRLVSKRSI